MKDFAKESLLPSYCLSERPIFPVVISPPAISLIRVEDDAVNTRKLNLTNGTEANNNNKLGPLAIKMQTFTLNVDLNHFNFVPNEA